MAENYSRSFQIVHFACHALVDPAQPIRSALVLSSDPSAGDDGFLQARELYSRRLEANLVILSACQSGRGRLETGEGILGLPRVFFYSGASSVITTLWPVGDAKAESFMARYYRRLAAGPSKAGALRDAKIEMIRSGATDPHEWAGFVLNGEPDRPISFH
jgi:CHAT domain-containing protein